MLYVTERSSYDTFHYDTLTLREFTVYCLPFTLHKKKSGNLAVWNKIRTFAGKNVSIVKVAREWEYISIKGMKGSDGFAIANMWTRRS